MHRRRVLTFALASMVAVTVAACGARGEEPQAEGSQTPAGSSPTAQTDGSEQTSQVDATFAATMIPHHEMGIEMTKMALEKAATPGVKQVAETAQASQQEQLPQLREIADAAGMEPMSPEPPLQELNDQQMAELQALQGEDFDRRWLDVFRSHHMAAIMMADVALATDDDGPAQALEQTIHDGQLDDVEQMNALRADLG
ncbi:hypothetical protein DNL40_15560 [Xylanimonas oleitrophica]|uniref:DUF305 domain-containing protein n=2 Tax=Xylanimonas oleitrophica TaxID=2607479 RepID=A0A2W5XQ97_9MICO|nr:hypothetical protein DNL40_15560 [Xylanimonas oleitrophica]